MKLAELLHRFVHIGPTGTFSQQIIYIVDRMNLVRRGDEYNKLFHQLPLGVRCC